MKRVRKQHVAGLALAIAGTTALGLARRALGDDGNLGTVGANGVAYHYQRGPFGVDLVDRNGHWTHDEALWVRNALDKLPDVYLRKALLGTGVNKFMRDGQWPSAPWDFVRKNVGNSAVAVPPAPWHYVSFADGTFPDERFTYETVTHELGHCCQWNEVGWGIIFGSPFTKISWTGFVEPSIGKKSWNGFVTDYAMTNQREDYAESCKFYWIDPDHLQQINPAKFAYMRDHVFDGVTSDPATRIDMGLRRWETPEVDSLSDSHDDEHSLVRVYGHRFMGPTDGGFNTVHFRGTSAWMHTPISEETIWAWTPKIDAGSAPVDVQTQDGTSNQVAFTLDKKPWWKFW